MSCVVRDIVKIMAGIAPPALAEKWDNVGLQVGLADWPVKRVRVALDPLFSVVEKAREDGVDMLITHHPLIFRPVKNVDLSTPTGKIIAKALESRMAIFSAHTNLDSVQGGMNDFLSRKLGLKDLRVFQGPEKPTHLKLAIYVPVDHEEKVLKALLESGAGKIGAYAKCSFRTRGKGTFEPIKEKAQPYIGWPGSLSQVDEVKIEAVVAKKDLNQVLSMVKKRHPYETMAYDVHTLENPSPWGLGRIGVLDPPMPLEKFALRIKQRLGVDSIRFAGRKDLEIDKVAVCSGSGSSLVKSFLASPARVYVSGDIHYHDARDAEQADRGIIDIGHFASEHIVTEMLTERLQKALEEKQLPVSVDACRLEKDPFRSV